jgi:hypothetical protein
MSLIWQNESQLGQWVSTSIILMTGSLLFYHMTRLKNPTLEVHPYIAAFIASGLIIIDVLLSGTSLYPYNLRGNEILEPESEDVDINYENEKSFRLMYSVLIGGLIILQLLICYYVVTDSIRRVRLKR